MLKKNYSGAFGADEMTTVTGMIKTKIRRNVLKTILEPILEGLIAFVCVSPDSNAANLCQSGGTKSGRTQQGHILPKAQPVKASEHLKTTMNLSSS
jgi:hypothetical protein